MKKIKIIFGVLSLLFLVIGSSSYAQNLNSGNITDYCPTGVTECDVSYTWIESIAVNTFVHHTGLEILNLEWNMITTIESWTFNGLINIQQLYLRGNQIETIEPGTFAELTNLEELYLSRNQIETIESWMFLWLDDLSEIYLSRNQISNIEPQTFAGLTNLTHLFLDENQLTSIEVGTFNGFNRLTDLHFDYNQISHLPCDIMNLNSLSDNQWLMINDNPLNKATLSQDMKTFLNLKAWTTYTLDSNDPYQVCGNFPILDLDSSNITDYCPTSTTECDLSYKWIKSIAVNTFVNHTTLEFLNLGNNQISTLVPGTFSWLNSLQLLFLGENKITSIQSEIFIGLDSLQQLELYNNQISVIEPLSFSELSNLQELFLDWNKISIIKAQTFFGLGNLTSFFLTNSQITTIESWAFEWLFMLEELFLYDNQLTTIQSGTFFGLDSLGDLCLNNNQILTIEPWAFFGLDNLAYLRLQDNQIKTLPCDIMNLNNLFIGTLYLDKDQLIESNFSQDMKAFLNQTAWTTYILDPNDPYQVCWVFPVIGELNSSNIVNAYYNCPINATECDLRSKSIKDIAVNTFVHHTGLIFLDLQDNQIETIKSWAFNGLSNLTLLSFDDNQIINIEPGAFWVLDNLIELYLRRNLIETIEPKTFFGLTNLESLYLSENNISSIQSWTFNGLGKLWELSLDFNQITNIQPGAFNGLENLKYLELGGNKITSIQSGAFIGLDSLDYLSLGLNQLSIIEPGAFIGLDSLQDFSLYSNKLLDLPCDIMNLTNLTYFNVDNNFLTGSTLSLDMKTFLNLKAWTTYTLSPNDPYQVCWVFGNTTTTTNWHLGWTSLGKDYCPNWDNSLSYYDGSCDIVILWDKEGNIHNSADETWDIVLSKYSQELINAHWYWYKLWLIKSPTIEKANMESNLTRKQLAKILTIYSIKFLKKEINTDLPCDFEDLKALWNEDRLFVKFSCQLWIMGLKLDGTPNHIFNPNGKVTRAEFGTAFSRLLYGNKNNVDDPIKRYKKHLQLLKNDWIMKKIEVPEMKESLGNVFLMLMRADIIF